MIRIETSTHTMDLAIPRILREKSFASIWALVILLSLIIGFVLGIRASHWYATKSIREAIVLGAVLLDNKPYELKPILREAK